MESCEPEYDFKTLPLSMLINLAKYYPEAKAELDKQLNTK